MLLYLDVCCLNRPFDDKSEDRVRMEAEAVLTILKWVEDGRHNLIKSDVIDIEISKILDLERKKKVYEFGKLAHQVIELDSNVNSRAKDLLKLNLKAFDAMHIASAEKGKADIFLTTDDGIIKKYEKNMNAFKVKIQNPLKWMAEVV